MWSYLKTVEDTINFAYYILRANAITAVFWSKTKMNEFLKSPAVQTIALYSIIFIGRIQAKAYLFAKHLYDQNEIIRVPADFILWSYETIEMMNIRHRQEPTSSRWLNVCSSTRLNRGAHIGKTPYNFSESYNNMNDLIDKDDMIRTFEIALETNAEVNTENKAYMDDDTIVIMKWDGLYKISRATTPLKPQTYDLEKSKVRFLSVEYTVSRDSVRLSLTVPTEMCVQGNELFSHAFVRRLLEYQPEPFEFDFNYRLTIMDGDVNEFELNNKQYIILSETGYELKEI
jgi:hypothetical protein